MVHHKIVKFLKSDGFKRKRSFLLAGTYVFIGLLTRRIDYGGYIPLGPFLASGLIIVWCIGKENILQFLI